MQPVVVGIAGGSGSGKSTVAAAVMAASAVPCVALTFDSYYHDHGHLDLEARARVNYDHPDSLDVDRFALDLAALRSGAAVAAPVYDFTTHSRSAAVQLIDPHPVIVVDGILLLAFPRVRSLLHVSVFVEVADDIRHSRRINRDVEERGRTAEQAMEQIAATVQPMHEQFVVPSGAHADVVVDGTSNPQHSAAAILHAAAVPLVAPTTSDIPA